ncbi:acyltransferase family protein [Pseudomonas sp. SDO55104_S430]
MNTAVNNLSRLTFTRFVAVLIVVAFHFGANIPPFNNEDIAKILRQGPYAVQYFFFLSGFIMASVYATNFPATFNKSKFWIARFARIYPVYLIGLGLSVLLSTPDPLTLILNMSLTQAWSPSHALSMNNPGWSLSVEVFFYAVFPAVLFILKKGNLWIGAIVAIVSCLAHEALNLYLIHAHTNGTPVNPLIDYLGPYFPLRSLPFFLAGNVMGTFAKNRQIPASIIAITSSALAMCVLLGVWIYFRLPMIVLPFGLLILSLTNSKNTGKLESRVAIFLGEASYAVYILHFPLYLLFLIYVAPHINSSETEKFYIYLAALIAISSATYSLVEKPARAYIRSASTSWTGVKQS